MKRKIIKAVVFATAFFSLFTSCHRNTSDYKTDVKEKRRNEIAQYSFQFVNQVKNDKEECLQKYIENLNLEQRIAQLFLVNINGNQNYLPVEKIHGKDLIPGGYIFFSFNLASTPSGIIDFTDSIKNYCTTNGFIQPFLSIDIEGGYVNRLRGIAGELPENERVSQCLTLSKAFELYSLNAVQLKLLGFNMNLAPVCEVCTKSNKEFLSGRSFGDSKAVIDYSNIACEAYEVNNVGTVVKHFPGNTNTDPHTGLPIIKLSKDEINKLIIEPFSKIINENVSGVLMSHAKTLEYDKDTPCCLSKYWVTDILRNQLGFEGLIFSDDIFMGALSKNGFPPEKAIFSAIDAGIDCILLSEKSFLKELELLVKECKRNPEFKNRINASVYRILSWKLNHGILNYEYSNNSWNISIAIKDMTSVQEREKEFDKVKKENSLFYDKHFLPTASKDELTAVMRK